jgi:hypothetical protein
MSATCRSRRVISSSPGTLPNPNTALNWGAAHDTLTERVVPRFAKTGDPNGPDSRWPSFRLGCGGGPRFLSGSSL